MRNVDKPELDRYGITVEQYNFMKSINLDIDYIINTIKKDRVKSRYKKIEKIKNKINKKNEDSTNN